MSDCRVYSHEWGVYGTQPTPRTQETVGERVQEPEFGSDCQQTVFFRHKSGCCHEFTAGVAPAQHQDSLDFSLHPSLDGGRLQEAPVLTEELLAVGGC